MIFIGIDPGLGGGIAMLDEFGRPLLVVRMPETERDIYDLLKEGFVVGAIEGQRLRSCRAILERVSASPQMGVVSAFTFGKGYGAIRMALLAADIPFDEVTPQKWQKALSCRTGGDKNVSKRRAQELFPKVSRMTHAIADALLLAEYGRRIYAPHLVQEEVK